MLSWSLQDAPFTAATGPRVEDSVFMELSLRCSDNNLTLNVQKTIELIMDFRRNRHAHTPHLINGEQVETVTTFRFLGTHISADHSWTYNIRALVKKAQLQATTLPVCPQEKQTWHQAAAGLLSLLCGERTDVLSGCVVHRLNSWGQEGGVEGHKHCPKDHRLPSDQPGTQCHILPPQETPHTLPIPCLICCPLGNSTGQQSPTPAGWQTAPAPDKN